MLPMASICQSSDGLKEMLQSAVQAVQWTYIIFWKLSPQELVLVWGDGYYNGSIKTRKTVQAMEDGTEEAALSRTEQLRELYYSLAAGEQPAMENQRRPSVALCPEDLTESEWFYLMCISFSFPPGVGLVGEAYTKQESLWLTGAHEVDSKVFSRAILAKSAHIQTVICIPFLNGVVELGTNEKVEESDEFVRHVKLFFVHDNNNLIFPSPKPTNSTHSSNTALSTHQIPTTSKPLGNVHSMDEDIENVVGDEEDFEEEDEYENGSDFVQEACHLSSFEEPHQDKVAMVPGIEANELLPIDISADVSFISPNDGSSNFDDYRFDLLATNHDDSCRDESNHRWLDVEMSTVQLQTPEIFQREELVKHDTQYSNTVSTILNNNHLAQWSNSPTNHNLNSPQTSFAMWTPNHPNYHHLPTKTSSNSQKVLKFIIFTVPFLHSNLKSVGLRKTVSHEELSANHVLAERRRREKLNERFIILRSLVPLVTKMDKASILGDTIQYVKQLHKKIQDLETRGYQYGLDSSTRKIRVVNSGCGNERKAATGVEVSIIESDALLEIQCVHRQGLLLDIMKMLRDLGVEITTVQSCVDGQMCMVEMRAKVEINNRRKKISIVQVKKAINQIISLMY